MRASGSIRRWSSGTGWASGFDAAVGASTELGAYARLREAVDRVRTREAWLHWVEDEGHRGLNAGPFELLTERREKPPFK